MLIQLLYTSTPTVETVKSVAEFIPLAQEMNDIHGITGMIVSSPEMYLQVIEGDRPQINQLYKNIVSDKRHTGCILLRYSSIKEREFDHWSMLHTSLSEINSLYVNAIFSKGRYNPDTITGIQAMALLHVVSNNLNTIHN